MKKKQIFDKNQTVVACLLLICVLLVFIIFFISNRTVPAAKEEQELCVTRADVAEAYAFLNQDEAIQAALDSSSSDEVFTYGAYRVFLEQLHLWEAGHFTELLDWEAQKDEGVSPDILAESRDVVAELFETTVAEQEKREEPVVSQAVSSMPQVDEKTKIRVLLLQNGEPLAKEIRFSANEEYSVSWRGKTKKKKKIGVKDRKSTRLNSSHSTRSGMPSSA